MVSSKAGTDIGNVNIYCLRLLPLIVGISVRSLFCLQYFVSFSNSSIISLGKRELVVLLLICSVCHVAAMFFNSFISNACYLTLRE